MRSLTTMTTFGGWICATTILVGVLGCGSNAGSSGDSSGAIGGSSFGGGPPGFGGYNPSAGGGSAFPSGGTSGGGIPSMGGAPNGGTFTGGGGTPFGSGGGSPIGSGGGDVGGSPGAGGAQAAGGGGATLGHCDMTKETSAAPITSACGDVITPTGTTIPLGPYGASMDVNVGKGFENPNPNDDATCPAFVNLFAGETQSTQLLDTGPQPCTTTTPNTGNCLNYTLYSVYRPANWPSGPIPVLTWGNGTCAQPEGYGALLRYIASYGFFIVAANSREVGSGTPITHALDFAAAANQDSTSPYFGHLDMTKVGVMGHSQGGQGAAAAAADARIQAAILVSPFPSGSTTKPFLNQGAEMDVTAATAASLASTVNAAPKAAYLFYHHPAGAAQDGYKGHLVLMLTPERVTAPFTAWWQMMLQNDATAKNQFVGASCGLCNHSADYDYGQHGL